VQQPILFWIAEVTNEQVVVDGQTYNNIHIMYDMFGDVLVLRFRDKRGLFALIQLDKKRVESFTLYQHRFRKMTNPISPEASIAHGYYDVLFDGKRITLVAKRRKEAT